MNAAPPRYFLLFSDASEQRVRLSAESKILASTFERFRLYRLLNLLYKEKLSFQALPINILSITRFVSIIYADRSIVENSFLNFLLDPLTMGPWWPGLGTIKLDIEIYDFTQEGFLLIFYLSGHLILLSKSGSPRAWIHSISIGSNQYFVVSTMNSSPNT